MLIWLAASLLYAVLLWLWLRVRRRLKTRLLQRLFWSIPLGIGTALGPAIACYQAVFLGHGQDSLLTLSLWKAAAVVCLALALAILTLQLAIAIALGLASWAGPRALPRTAALLANLALIPLVFATLLPLVPQIFYQLYRFLFTGLPQQWVLSALFDWSPFWRSIALAPGSSLSEIATGLLFWSLILPSLLMHVCPPQQES